MTHSVNGVSQALPWLPLAFEYIYEFPSPFGGIHRKMSPARWNGNEVSKSYLVYTAAQMCEYARAAIAVQTPAAREPVAAPTPVTDEQILHVWDTHVGDPNPKYPFTDADKIEFARAVLALAAVQGKK